MKLDLDNSNVKEVEVTVQEIRDFIDGKDSPGLSSDIIDTWLDEAQGEVFSSAESVYYLVIKVTK